LIENNHLALFLTARTSLWRGSISAIPVRQFH